MILKEKEAYAGSDDRGFYGHKQEQDVAFHLRREFGENDQVHIINDLLIEHEGERAQIDHLVIHPFGFIVIESKSVVGEVKVNSEGEWSRSYQGRWSGMPSPIRQAELQQKLLRDLLGANVEKFLGTIFGIQTRVAHREWDILCAISSTAILHRDRMPKQVASKVVKTEFLAKKVRDTVGGVASAFFKGKPKFSKQELDDIGSFLLEHTARLKAPQGQNATAQLSAPETAAVGESASPPYTAAPEPDAARPIPAPAAQALADDNGQLTCKQCGEASHLTGMYGQYG